MIHPWKRCRFNGCDNCCSCGEECSCVDDFTTAEDLIEALKLLDPKDRIVLADPCDEDNQLYNLHFFKNCAIKPYTTEAVPRIWNYETRGYEVPEGAELCYVIYLDKDNLMY